MRNVMHRRRAVVLVTALIMAALVLAGARFAAYLAFMSAPDHVHIVVTRVQNSSQDASRTTVFDRQFGAVAQQIYAQLVAGERIPPDAVTSCPAGAFTYYHYELTFSRAGIQTSIATSDAQGCLFITLAYLGGQDVFSWYDNANDVSFWVRLHQLVNAPLPINAIYSVP